MQKPRWLRQAGLQVSWQGEKDTHDIDHQHNDQDNRAYPIKSTSDTHIVVGHMHQRLHPPRNNKDPGKSDEEKIGMMRDDLKDRQHIKKNRQFELIGK